MNRPILLYLALILTSACSESSTKTVPVPPAPLPLDDSDVAADLLGERPSLDFSEFKIKSFADVPWEKKCEGLSDFVKDYAKAYLENVQVDFDLEKCLVRNGFDGEVRFQPSFTLSKDGFQQQFLPDIVTSFDFVNRNLGIKSSYTNPIVTRSMARRLGDHIVDLQKTLSAWIIKGQTQEVSVFGLPYGSYATRFETGFGAGTPGLPLYKGAIVLQVIPSSEIPGSGTVKFLKVEDRVFEREELSGEKVSTPFLGCEDMECLGARTVEYKLMGPTLILQAPHPTFANYQYVSFFKFKTLEW